MTINTKYNIDDIVKLRCLAIELLEIVPTPGEGVVE